MRHTRALLASGPLAAALFAVPGLASAGIPTGNFAIEFGGRQSIWMGEEGSDSGEKFCADFESGFDDLELCDFQAFVDGKGKIFGYFEFSGWSEGIHFAASGPIKGSQKGDDRSGISSVSLLIKLVGVASDGVEKRGAKASIRLNGQTTADGVMSGVWETSVCVQGGGCSSDESPVPPEVATNGGWSLELEITDGGGGALAGAARVELGSGDECFYAVTGKYSAKNDLASLSLLPTEPACAGTSLKAKNVRALDAAPGVLFGSIAYKLFGFTGAITLLPPLPGSLRMGTSGGSNQELFAWLCNGTVTIAASLDPSACSWGPAPSPYQSGITMLVVGMPSP
jgi:hypothetical protein